METQQNYPLGYRRNIYGGDWNLWSEFMAVFLRSICQAASLESPTLGIYYRDSKPVPIKPIKWPYTVNQLGNHTGKNKHMHNLIKVSG